MLTFTAPAKVNLSLHVTGKRDDGYHLLDSLVVFAEFGDRLTLEPGKGKPVTLEITGPFSSELPADKTNLVFRAALQLREAAARQGFPADSVKIILEKNLPIASGMGGGSADAATTLRALNKFWKLDDKIDLFELAGKLGADVPMCLSSKPLRACGIGEAINHLEMPEALHLLLVNPLVSVSTPQVFGKLKSRQNPGLQMGDKQIFPALKEILAMRNDLETPAVSLVPDIAGVLEAIRKTGCILARMSGSGATCFGIYPDETRAFEAAETIRKANPRWWCIATKSIVK